ncbi:MAG: DNA-directed RNA polymerase subunit H [Methanophagales archaeon]|nr:DNA-directed RNA polymerase subunit H [Methanophagales archaeon]RLG35543.1 MAG: DNA-directed RNA polymerase subunit H [Methanosarcinales archaeon]MCW3138875.1 DNA-directed RNA polymerase subunit H [Methanophagales archaeon]MCW3139352.1 DNA-directed RNA polymerase subunit H [Methanophagales archaeon]MCW7069116.1 DNA-directed RNA polymerase subunit H [Methanophagales archaeon]
MKKGKVSILEHELVPLHEVMTEREVEELLNKYKIKKEQLPKIKSSDPVIKEIKAREGDVVRIMRKSRTAGRFISYRLVTK